MPIHDWTLVDVGVFHSFHIAWLSGIKATLNQGLLPSDHYALVEQVIGSGSPDVLTLQMGQEPSPEFDETDEGGVLAMAKVRPETRFVADTELSREVFPKRRIVVRHVSGHHIVAIIEIVSPGNKHSINEMEAFVYKAVDSLQRGYHLLIVDLFPPTVRDPEGIHGKIWQEINAIPYHQPDEDPLTLVSYLAGPTTTAYVEPTAVGNTLKNMPVFLSSEKYVNLPLEATYQDAFSGLPAFYRAKLNPVA
ncbi:MAG: DUF4058 family protein [Fimbriiglobus sp.]